VSDYLLFPMVEPRDVLGAYPASLLLVCPAGRVLLHLDSQVRPGSVPGQQRHGGTFAADRLPQCFTEAALHIPIIPSVCVWVLLCSAALWWDRQSSPCA
jgi:hypothetical protein